MLGRRKQEDQAGVQHCPLCGESEASLGHMGPYPTKTGAEAGGSAGKADFRPQAHVQEGGEAQARGCPLASHARCGTRAHTNFIHTQ